jgi:hypothetical protein
MTNFCQILFHLNYWIHQKQPFQTQINYKTLHTSAHSSLAQSITQVKSSKSDNPECVDGITESEPWVQLKNDITFIDFRLTTLS